MSEKIICEHTWICDYCIDCGSYLISIRPVKEG